MEPKDVFILHPAILFPSSSSQRYYLSALKFLKGSTETNFSKFHWTLATSHWAVSSNIRSRN